MTAHFQYMTSNFTIVSEGGFERGGGGGADEVRLYLSLNPTAFCSKDQLSSATTSYCWVFLKVLCLWCEAFQ